MAARPTAAHRAIAALPALLPSTQISVLTQNVDNLHERAGTGDVVKLHGDIFSVACSSCGHTLSWGSDIEGDECCPLCEAVGYIRPNVVLFGEAIRNAAQSETLISSCDVLLVIGCSLVVAPVSDFVVKACKRQSCYSVNINPSPGTIAQEFSSQLRDDADVVLPAVVAEIYAQS